MFISDDTIVKHGGTPVSTAMLDQANDSVRGKECLSCGRIKYLGEFKRDASYREGVRDQCLECESAPRYSTEEHILRLREKNYRAASAQRWTDQEDFRNEKARWGRAMPHPELIRKIQKLTDRLYFMPGRIEGDIAVFKTYGSPQPHLANEAFPEGRTFEYLFYIPTGYMPEFSLIEFSERDIPVKEHQRGWRTVLLRLIKSRIITEKQCDEEFGTANGAASHQWHKQLFMWRNGHA